MNKALALLILLIIPVVSMAQAQTSDATATKSEPYDSTDSLSLLAAAGGGGGWMSGTPVAQAGIKLGGYIPVYGKSPKQTFRTITLDLGYDRIAGKNGFSTEGSLMLPLFRYPKPSADPSKNFIRVYAEPGLGYRAGDGPFGQYSSAKVLVVLFSDKRLGLNKGSPFIEFQRRFPFSSPLHGDNRVSFGIMLALCSSCGVD